MGIRLRIIELRKYNEIGKLLKELEPQGCRHKYTIGMGSRRHL